MMMVFGQLSFKMAFESMRIHFFIFVFYRYKYRARLISSHAILIHFIHGTHARNFVRFFKEKSAKEKIEFNESIKINCEINELTNESNNSLKVNRFRGYFENRKAYSAR